MESGSGTHFRWQGFEIQKVVENVLRRVHGSNASRGRDNVS